jgi:prophage DNA circulation protein
MANPKQASWRGISFYYRGSTEQRGFKTVQHLYPGSNNFKIEQMGKMPKQFTISAQIDDDNRDVLDAALNASGSGILSHPKYGNFTAKVTTYTKSDSIDKYGLYDYSITFIIEFGLFLPSLSTLTTSAISSLRAAGIGKVKSFGKSKLKRFGF